MATLMEERRLSLAEPGKASPIAYIYNGLEDVELMYVGQKWSIPGGKVTEVKPYKWKEVDQMKSDGGRIVWTLEEVEGEIVARELVEKHGWHERGIVVFLPGKSDEQIAEIKQKADEQAKVYKLGRIEQFRRDRELARAGKAGFKLYPDENVRRWMKEYEVHDDIFNPTDIEGDVDAKVQQAVATAIQPFVDMFERLMKGKLVAATVRKPAKKSFEAPEEYAKRLEAWEAEQRAVEASLE